MSFICIPRKQFRFYNLLYAPFGTDTNNQTWGWFKTVQEAVKGIPNHTITWDNDYVLIGNSAFTFVLRGGGSYGVSSVGLLHSNVTKGSEEIHVGFRSVLVV